MGRLVTLTNLREEVRQRYDLATFSTNSFETNAAINAAINSSLQAFYAILLEAYGDDYFDTYTDLTTTAGVDLQSLPPRFYKLKSLVWLRAKDDPVPLRPADLRDALLSGLSAQSWTAYTPRYRLHGMNTLRWLPTPSAAYTVRCTYAALPADLVADTDTFDAGPGWEEWVVADVCAKLAQREQSPDVGVFLSARAEWRDVINAQARDRDEGEPQRIRDAYGRTVSDYELRNALTLRGY